MTSSEVDRGDISIVDEALSDGPAVSANLFFGFLFIHARLLINLSMLKETKCYRKKKEAGKKGNMRITILKNWVIENKLFFSFYFAKFPTKKKLFGQKAKWKSLEKKEMWILYTN